MELEGTGRFHQGAVFSAFWVHAIWKYKITFLFHKCTDTKTLIWPFTRAYSGTAMWNGPGSPAIEQRWLIPSSYIFLKLTGKIG